jgi:hypothetical protein
VLRAFLEKELKHDSSTLITHPLWAKERVLTIIMPADKTKEDRLSEGLELLRALLRTGVSEDDPAYTDTKSKISEWVNTGVSWEGRIEFPQHGRYASVRLPKNSLNTATLAFKVKKGSYPSA